MFNFRSLLPALACILAAGQVVNSAPHAGLGTMEDLPSEDHMFTKRAITMEDWAGNKDSGSASWKKELPSPFSSADTAKKNAKEGYDYVMSQTPSNHKKDIQLVAALFIPSGPQKGIYLASIPKDPGSQKMDKKKAPAWAHQIEGRTPYIYHAEDLAMWLFEDSLTTKLGATDQYPRGSTMYVYGHFKNDKGDAEAPKYQPPCSISGPDPSCTQVLTHLGITMPNLTD